MKIPGHRLTRKLGQGGMAAVFLGTQDAFDRQVAVKILTPKSAADEDLAARFLREAKTVAKLAHPHIIPVYDFGSHEGFYYMSMEHLPGGTLDVLLKAGLELSEALRIIEDVASALNFAHSKGIVHRDVKPENIMFREDHSAVLMDFGIARRQDASDGMTVAGAVMGTPRYMSPEQIRGKELDGRCDIYALGIMFHEMLMRKVPYDSEDYMALAMKHVKDPIPRLPHQFASAQHFLERLMAKDPDQRFQTGEEVQLAARQLRETGEYQSGTKVTSGGGATVVPANRKKIEEKKKPKPGVWIDEVKTKSGFFSNKYQLVCRIVSDDVNRFSLAFNSVSDQIAEWHKKRKGSCESLQFNIAVGNGKEAEPKVRAALRKLKKGEKPYQFMKKLQAEAKFIDLDTDEMKEFKVK